jgi:hypothetical protein
MRMEPGIRFVSRQRRGSRLNGREGQAAMGSSGRVFCWRVCRRYHLAAGGWGDSKRGPWALHAQPTAGGRVMRISLVLGRWVVRAGFRYAVADGATLRSRCPP